MGGASCDEGEGVRGYLCFGDLEVARLEDSEHFNSANFRSESLVDTTMISFSCKSTESVPVEGEETISCTNVRQRISIRINHFLTFT